uniref:Uncharacterized protein n=1 Tax=Anopheles culicifacies TaxID=139723 RepID=A0A182M7D1_9DIPT
MPARPDDQVLSLCNPPRPPIPPAPPPPLPPSPTDLAVDPGAREKSLIQEQERLWSERLVKDLRIEITSLHGHLDLLNKGPQLGGRLYRVLSTSTTATDSIISATGSTTLIERSHGVTLSA